MSNVTLPGTGSVVEAGEVGGALRQVVQVANLPDTQPVSAVALPLPTGAATEATAATKVRVLVEGNYGKPDDVIELEGEALAQALASGQVDPHPDAVAYAEGLKA